MKTVKELKQTVLQRLRCCWGENTAIFFISAGGIASVALAWFMTTDFLAAFGAADPSRPRADLSNGAILAVTAIALAMLFAIAEPFRFGVKWYRLQQVRGNSVHARSIFSCYGSWKRAGQIFKLDAYLFLRRLYFTAPLAALLGSGIFLVNRIETSENSVAYSAAAVLALLLAGSVICTASAMNCKYAAAEYLFVMDPDASPKKLADKSVELTRGRSDYIMEAFLSSAIWLPSCLLIFPMVFAVPYMQMINTAAVNEIITSEKSGESTKQDGKREDTVEREYAHN